MADKNVETVDVKLIYHTFTINQDGVALCYGHDADGRMCELPVPLETIRETLRIFDEHKA